MSSFSDPYSSNTNCDDYDEISVEEESYHSMLSTVWEESSKDLSDSFVTLKSRDDAESSRRKPTRRRARSKSPDLDNNKALVLAEESEKKNQDESELGETESGETLEESDEEEGESSHHHRVSLDSFFNSNSHSPKAKRKQAAATAPQHQRISLDSFLTDRTEEEVVETLVVVEEEEEMKKTSLDSFFTETNKRKEEVDQEFLEKATNFVTLVSYLTGEEVLMPESDDEFTFVSCTTEGTSITGDAISLMSGDARSCASEAADKDSISEQSSSKSVETDEEDLISLLALQTIIEDDEGSGG
jgi:hypothetical protein